MSVACHFGLDLPALQQVVSRFTTLFIGGRIVRRHQVRISLLFPAFDS